MAKLRKPRKSQKRWDISSTSLPLQLPDVFAVCEGKHYSTEHVQTLFFLRIQSVPGEKVNILGGHSIGHSKQETLYEHDSYSERFPR
jgi:hypothetical protein